ncbi:MAG: ATP-binding protein [Gammaproteobacteria bacterium]
MSSLYRRIALIFAILLLVFGGLCGGLELLSAKKHQQEIVQSLSRGLADHIASHWALFKQDEFDKKAAEDLFYMLMVVNPSIELYLLDTEGKIISYNAPPGRVRLQRVDLKPIQTFLSGANLPLKGDNPRNPDSREIFSATQLSRDGQPAGYLYIILAGDDYYRLANDIWRGHVFRSAMLTGTGVLILTLLSGLFLFYLLTRRLNQLTSTVTAFDRADFSGGFQIRDRIVRSSDEIGRLATAFSRMAQRIEMQVEQIKAQDEMRREMVANVSHDLRTPLTSMQGYLETMLRKSDQLTAAQRQQYLEVAVRQSRRVTHLAQELFELAKLELKEVKPNFERFSVQELIQDVAQKFELAAKSKGVNITAQFHHDFPQVYADIEMIDRVLSNLLDNALRHTPADGLIELSLQANMPDTVRICIKDSGAGIAQEHLPGLFERDSVLRKTPRKHSGGGLGLLISKRILELHGSDIEAFSREGNGTMFMFNLPSAMAA